MKPLRLLIDHVLPMSPHFLVWPEEPYYIFVLMEKSCLSPGSVNLSFKNQLVFYATLNRFVLSVMFVYSDLY